MCTTDFHEEIIITEDCHVGNNRTVQRNATKKIIIPRIATVKRLNLRADCQGVSLVVAIRGTLDSGLPRGIPFVANSGIGARFATNE
jgi:hypothetical protein